MQCFDGNDRVLCMRCILDDGEASRDEVLAAGNARGWWLFSAVPKTRNKLGAWNFIRVSEGPVRQEDFTTLRARVAYPPEVYRVDRPAARQG